MGHGFISSPEIDMRQSILGTLVDSIIQFFCLRDFFCYCVYSWSGVSGIFMNLFPLDSVYCKGMNISHPKMHGAEHNWHD